MSKTIFIQKNQIIWHDYQYMLTMSVIVPSAYLILSCEEVHIASSPLSLVHIEEVMKNR